MLATCIIVLGYKAVSLAEVTAAVLGVLFKISSDFCCAILTTEPWRLADDDLPVSAGWGQRRWDL